MADSVQILRGNKADLPTLLDGSFGYCEDTNELYIGNASKGNQLVSFSGVSNRNLLINSNFLINQRGLKSYTTNLKYTVDRWKVRLLSAGESVVPTDNGITLNVLAEGSQYPYVTQYIEIPDSANFVGKTLTMSASINNVIYTASGVVTEESNNNRFLVFNFISDGIMDGGCDWESTGILRCFIRVNVTKTINWVKLEIGSVATPYESPNVAEELIKCQRYYETVGSWTTRAFDSQYDITVPFKVTKRITPTITFSSPNKTEGKIGYWNGTDFTDITPPNNGDSYAWMWRITGTLEQTGVVRLNLFADADI